MCRRLLPAFPPLKTLTLAQIAHGLNSGTFTVVQLVQTHLDQIARFNGALRAVLQVNPNTLAIARALDAEMADPEHRRLRPLHGVPLLVKDNIVTSEPALEATAGSLALLGAKPARENAAVTRLREAGCVLLGTTNCSGWASSRTRPSDNGWSARGGQTYGTYHERQDPFGSSSGSGVAVDIGFCVLALATETSGSIIGPAEQKQRCRPQADYRACLARCSCPNLSGAGHTGPHGTISGRCCHNVENHGGPGRT